jgi:hypothetical protein
MYVLTKDPSYVVRWISASLLGVVRGLYSINVVTLLWGMLGYVWLWRAMQQSPPSRGLRISSLWALVWALIVFVIFIAVMAWSMSR